MIADQKIIATLNIAHDGIIHLIARDLHGFTALDFAVEHDKEEIVSLLLQRSDIEPDMRKGNGLTPLMVACHRGNKRVLQRLLHREDVNVNANCDEQFIEPGSIEEDSIEAVVSDLVSCVRNCLHLGLV